MKKLIIAVIIASSVISTGVNGSPELVEPSSGLNDLTVISSDYNNFDPKTEAETLESVISNKVQISYLDGFWDTEPKISGINDDETIKNESRTCQYCGFFLILYALILIVYGEKIRIKPDTKNWFFLPLFFGVVIFVVHNWVHEQFASSFFLNYYWIWLADELIMASFIYWAFFINPQRKYLLSLSVKQKKEEKNLTS